MSSAVFLFALVASASAARHDAVGSRLAELEAHVARLEMAHLDHDGVNQATNPVDYLKDKYDDLKDKYTDKLDDYKDKYQSFKDKYETYKAEYEHLKGLSPEEAIAEIKDKASTEFTGWWNGDGCSKTVTYLAHKAAEKAGDSACSKSLFVLKENVKACTMAAAAMSVGSGGALALASPAFVPVCSVVGSYALKKVCTKLVSKIDAGVESDKVQAFIDEEICDELKIEAAPPPPSPSAQSPPPAQSPP